MLMSSDPKFHAATDLPGVVVCTHRFTGPLKPGYVAHSYALWQLVEGANDVAVYKGAGALRRSVCEPGRVQLIEPGDYLETRKRYSPETCDVSVLIAPRAMEKVVASVTNFKSVKLSFAGLRSESPLTPKLAMSLAGSIVTRAPLLEREVRLAALTEHLLNAEHGEVQTARPAGSRTTSDYVREYLHANYSENVSLAELEASTGISRYHLARRFKADYGVPPHSYLMRLRVSRAQLLLLYGASPAQAAIEVGFTDQSHFYRVHRQLFGYAPGVYVRGVRGRA